MEDREAVTRLVLLASEELECAAGFLVWAIDHYISLRAELYDHLQHLQSLGSVKEGPEGETEQERWRRKQKAAQDRAKLWISAVSGEDKLQVRMGKMKEEFESKLRRALDEKRNEEG